MIYNKFNMTVDENVFVAKRNIVDYIYKSAKLEGISVTYPDTAAIINNGQTQGLSVSDIVAINNLKHAWMFVLDTLDYPTDYPLICEINRIVGANLFYGAGAIRNIPVTIGGTKWVPALPIEADIKDEIKSILHIDNNTERAITLMLHLMRRQMFIDGNKRTAMLAANHVMIQSGAGIISMPPEVIDEFYERLIAYYESNDIDELKTFVFENAIDGLDMALARNNGNVNSFEEWKTQIDNGKTETT